MTVVSRDGGVKLIGNEAQVSQAAKVLNELLELSKRGNQITEQNVDYALSLAMEEKSGALLDIDGDMICHTISGSQSSRRRWDRKIMWMLSEKI